jgi:serine phosphatase RsbU (regulator of sigma subunit)
MVTDITKQKEMENEIRNIHKHTRESIEYASLIQSSLVPDNELFRKYFQDYFTIWHPKDIVGGDIYLFEELRDENECLLMVIDCTGHGVPGAFVTMLVKAIERQIVTIIANNKELEVSPAWCLEYFNKNMKKLLHQEDGESISNAGFDGQIIYYNKAKKIVKCASAKNEIFYVQDDKVNKIKGDRHSIGYKDSNINFKFTEHTIDVSKPTTLYISSDGYWDQMGGEKERSFGKKRLVSLIDEIKDEPLAEQQEEFIYTLHEYQGNHERQDDVTFIGLKI